MWKVLSRELSPRRSDWPTGRIVLADDYGYGNQVLEYLDIDARFSGDTLFDPLINYRNQNLPRIVHFNPDPLTIGLEGLGFNHATSILHTSNTSILAQSSSFSFLDTNNDGMFDDEEPVGPLPVISRHYKGEGEIILVSDPSLFINSMEPLDENEVFIRNIADSTNSLYIDQSHLPPSDLHQTKDFITRGREFLAEPLVTAGVITLAIAVTLRPIWHRKKETAEKEKGDNYGYKTD